MDLDYEKILFHCYEGEPLAYSRWGDGEFRCIVQKGEHNCDKHKYYPDLGIELGRILKSQPDYYMGMATHEGMSSIEKQRDQYLINNGILKKFCRTDIFVTASKQGRLIELIKSFEGKKIVLIGKSALGKLDFDFKLWEISEKNCWLNYTEDIELLKYTDYDIYLFCAGMMSNVMIDELYKNNPNKIYLDLGSCLDPYAGLNTRGYHKQLEHARL